MTTNEIKSQAPTAAPAVDFEQLRAASGDDSGFMQDLTNLYFEQAREIMTGLGKALKERSAGEVDYLAHKLAGASLSCGMSAMVAPLRELESRGRKGDLTGADGFMAQATANLEVVRASVQEYLRSAAAA
jgi:HPt (histidine-containing phosphotransfer) domain-containing protein